MYLNYGYGKDEYNKGYNYGKDGYNDEKDDYGKQVFVAKMNGENILPNPVDSPMVGFSKLIVTKKPARNYEDAGKTQLDYKVSVSNVPQSTDIIAAHLHIINPNAQNPGTGPHVLTLCGFDEPVIAQGQEIECPEKLKPIVAGGATNRDVEEQPSIGIFTIDDIVDPLNEGRGYMQVHTDINPTGEIRGDLTVKNNYRY